MWEHFPVSKLECAFCKVVAYCAMATCFCLPALSPGLIGFIAVAVYTDLHIWDLGDGRRLLEARRDLLVRAYETQAHLGYSFIVCVLAAGLLIASFAMAWRILLIFPNLAGPTSIFHQSVVERTTIEDKASKTKTTSVKKETATYKRSGSPDLSEAEVMY